MTDTKITLLLCLFCAVLASIGLTGLAHGDVTTLSILRSLPVHKSDMGEEPSLRDTRLAEIADAIDAHAGTREERALLLAIGKHESHFAADVCDGRRLGDDGRAYGCFQSHDRDRSGGINGQVQRAIRDIRRARNYCAHRGYHPIKGALSLYGTGRTCGHNFPARLATYDWIVRRL